MLRYDWFERHLLPTRSLTRPGQRPCWFFWTLLALAQLPVALLWALFIVLAVRPSVIVGVGGYASFPPLFWGLLLNVPVLIHEQNFFPGLVNRLFAPFAQHVFLSYPETARWLRARALTVTGLPVRPALFSATPDPARFGLQSGAKTVLVLGGSRGSHILTQTALAVREQLKDVQFLVVTGDRQAVLNGHGARTALVPYIDEIGTAFATADLVVSRAGAATLAELAALRKPAIVVPWKGAAGDHQTLNAQRLAQNGGCWLLSESELSPRKLADSISAFFQKPVRSQSAVAGQQALNHILHEIEVLLDA